MTLEDPIQLKSSTQRIDLIVQTCYRIKTKLRDLADKVASLGTEFRMKQLIYYEMSVSISVELPSYLFMLLMNLIISCRRLFSNT